MEILFCDHATGGTEQRNHRAGSELKLKTACRIKYEFLSYTDILDPIVVDIVGFSKKQPIYETRLEAPTRFSSLIYSKGFLYHH